MRPSSGECIGRSGRDFNPRFIDKPGMGFQYEDGSVIAAVDVNDGCHGLSVAIHEWTSLVPGHGNTVRALQWMRSQGFTHIVANGVGVIEDGVGDIATCYWKHMHEKGLVDVLLDDEGNNVTCTKK